MNGERFLQRTNESPALAVWVLSGHDVCMPIATATAFHRATELTRDELLRVAVARGCRHYAPLLSANGETGDDPDLPHEVLGTALLRGPADAATFQAIRCAAMVLSDLGNSPAAIAEASRHFGVEHRVAHIAELGIAADSHPEFWRALLDELQVTSQEHEFLPGVSRLVADTGLAGRGRSTTRVWLRTHYRR